MGLCCVCLALPLFSQNIFQRLSHHDFTDRGNALEVLPDGSTIIVGSFA